MGWNSYFNSLEEELVLKRQGVRSLNEQPLFAPIFTIRKGFWFSTFIKCEKWCQAANNHSPFHAKNIAWFFHFSFFIAHHSCRWSWSNIQLRCSAELVRLQRRFRYHLVCMCADVCWWHFRYSCLKLSQKNLRRNANAKQNWGMELLPRNTISDPTFTRDQPWQLSGHKIIYNMQGERWI